MPLNKIREYILENPKESSEKIVIEKNIEKKVYIRENICDIFEIHYSEENGKKYKHIIENVRKYVEKMLED